MKYKGHISTGYVGCKQEFEFEIDDEELAGFKTIKEREKFITDMAFECAMECIEWYYQEDDGTENS